MNKYAANMYPLELVVLSLFVLTVTGLVANAMLIYFTIFVVGFIYMLQENASLHTIFLREA